MRNALAVAVFGVSLGIGVVIGCSAPSPDGTGVNTRGRGSSGSSGDDDQADGSGSKTSTEPAATCESHAPVDDRPACDQCARAKCCAQVLECDKTADCEAMMNCLADCDGDLACGLTCQIAHEKGADALSEVAACAQTKCAAECPSQGLGDAGLDLDAF